MTKWYRVKIKKIVVTVHDVRANSPEEAYEVAQLENEADALSEEWTPLPGGKVLKVSETKS
jgi:hypothetical protein